MANDKYTLILEGEDSDLVRKIDKTTDRLNKQRDLVLKFNKERAAIARADRKEAFNALSAEEKRVKLARQQLDLERHLARARQQGNSVRESALRLSLARNQLAMRGVNAGAAAGAAGAFTGIGLLRAGPVGAIAAALVGSARSALNFADEMSDLAEQIGVSRKEIVEITRAAGYAGVSSRQIIGNLSTLSATRSAALSGDEKARDLFAKYGIDPTQGNIVELAQKIAGSLGPGGMQASDRGAMGQFFGRRPEGILATIRNIESVGDDVESKIQRLDAANARIEQFWNKVKEVNATAFASILQLWDSYSKLSSDPRAGSIGPMNGLDFVMSKRAPLTGSHGNMGDLRRLDDTVINQPARTPLGVSAEPTFRSPVAQADSLARMGLYIGNAGPNSPQMLMKQQLAELKAIKEAARATGQTLNRNL